MHFQFDALTWLDTNDEPVLVLIIDLQRRFFEADRNTGIGFVQAFGRADIEWHTFPARIVDKQFQSSIGFNHAVIVAQLFQVARHFFTVDFTSSILCAESMFFQLVDWNRANFFQQFDLGIAHTFWGQVFRLFHGS